MPRGRRRRRRRRSLTKRRGPKSPRRIFDAHAAHLRVQLLRCSLTHRRMRSLRCSSLHPDLDHLVAESLVEGFRPRLRSSAACVVDAHRLDDVGVQVHDLASRRDEGDDDDERDQGQDERELDHPLSFLASFELHQSGFRPRSLTVEPGVLVVASARACSTTTRTMRLRQKWLRSALSRGLAGLAAMSAVSRIVSACTLFPFRNSSAAVASSGCEATADSTMRQPTTSSPSSWTATAAPAIGKSIEPRRRSFTYAVQVFGSAGSLSDVTTSLGCLAM